MSSKQFAMLATDALHSRKIDGLTLAAEAAYYRLHMASDKFGTMPGSMHDVMSRAFASRKHVDAAQVEALLDELDDARLIERWTEDGDEWLAITGFDRHSTSEYKRKRKRYYPVPPSQREDRSDRVPTTFPESTPRRGSDPVPTRVEVSGGEIPLSPASATADSGLPMLVPAERYVADIEREAQRTATWQRMYHALVDQQERSELATQKADGSARAELAAVPESVGGEPLDDVGRDLPAAAHPRRRPQDDSAASHDVRDDEALSTPGSSSTHHSADSGGGLTAKRDQLGGAA